MTDSTRKFINKIILFWSTLLAIIYTGTSAVCFMSTVTYGILYLIVAIGWAILAVLAILMYSKLNKQLIAD